MMAQLHNNHTISLAIFLDLFSLSLLPSKPTRCSDSDFNWFSSCRSFEIAIHFQMTIDARKMAARTKKSDRFTFVAAVCFVNSFVSCQSLSSCFCCSVEMLFIHQFLYHHFGRNHTYKCVSECANTNKRDSETDWNHQNVSNKIYLMLSLKFFAPNCWNAQLKYSNDRFCCAQFAPLNLRKSNSISCGSQIFRFFLLGKIVCVCVTEQELFACDKEFVDYWNGCERRMICRTTNDSEEKKPKQLFDLVFPTWMTAVLKRTRNCNFLIEERTCSFFHSSSVHACKQMSTICLNEHWYTVWIATWYELYWVYRIQDQEPVRINVNIPIVIFGMRWNVTASSSANNNYSQWH